MHNFWRTFWHNIRWYEKNKLLINKPYSYNYRVKNVYPQ